MLKNDAASIAAVVNDKTIARNLLNVPYPYYIEDARAWICRCRNMARRKDPTAVTFAIEIDGKAAGATNIFNIHDHKAEIGYWLGREYWSKGIMTRVVRELTRFGFEKLSLRRLYAHTFTYNKASMRVLEKAGYKHEALLRKMAMKKGKLYDWHLFAKVK